MFLCIVNFVFQKPEVDMSGVPQSMPLDISGPTTPSEHDAPNSQSAHSGKHHHFILVLNHVKLFAFSTTK